MAKSGNISFRALRAIHNEGWKEGELPDRIKVLDWGINKICDGTEVVVNELSARVFDKNQKFSGRTEVPLDYNHCTCKDSPEYKVHGDKPSIFAYGVPRIIQGDGLWLENLRWTPYGQKYARNCADISPAPALIEKGGVVLGLDSAALTPTGAVNDLHFYSASSMKSMAEHLYGTDRDELDGGNIGDVTFGMDHHEPDGNEANTAIKPRGVSTRSNNRSYKAGGKPDAYASIDQKYDQTAAEIMNHVKNFRAIIGSAAEGKTDDEVMTMAAEHMMATWEGPTHREGPLNNPRPGIKPNVRGGEGEAETDDVEAREHGGVTISYEAVRKLVDATVKPLQAKIEDFEKRDRDSATANEQAQKDLLISQATREGKIIPLTAETVKVTPLAAIKEIIAGVKPTVPTKPIVRPLSATQDGKKVVMGAGRSSAVDAWNNTARDRGMSLGAGAN